MSKNKLSAVERQDATDAYCQDLNSLTLAESDKRFTALMHRFMSANERLKLAAAKLRDAFVVEEATHALGQIFDDFESWDTGLDHAPKASKGGQS